ncbi:NAD-dependent deacetylase hst3 [Coemansia sp. Benny D115]|nr:NAD-dependent deacetylase hst3 [Coemansia sp. Benny D115]
MQRLNLSDLGLDSANRPSADSPEESTALLSELQRAVRGCQRCIIITGAGISVSSGIPDFRSPDGLFQQLKQKYPNAVSNGKDLFDATLFTDPEMISVFYNFMGELRSLISQATCTPTHMFIKELDECGKLLRCYTQNIDSLEKRIGLETAFQKPAMALESTKAAQKGKHSAAGAAESDNHPVQNDTKDSSCAQSTDTATMQPGAGKKQPQPQPQPQQQQQIKGTRQRRQTTLDKTFTKAVQLHGDLDNVVCTICHTRYPFTEKLAEEFCEGLPPPCPRCKEIEVIRDLVGKRSVASGVLRPDIVLYNEAHPQSEVIGELSEYDLKRRPDLLIVIGTSLKIPGIKRMVKEMSRSVRACSLKAKRAGAGKAIFINRDEPPRGWEDVFDYYVSGDSDQAISLLPIQSTDIPDGRKPVKLAMATTDQEYSSSAANSSGVEDNSSTKSEYAMSRPRSRKRSVNTPNNACTTLDNLPLVPATSGNGRKRATRGTGRKTKQETSSKTCTLRDPPANTVIKRNNMFKVVKKSNLVSETKTNSRHTSKTSSASPISPVENIPTSPLVST